MIVLWRTTQCTNCFKNIFGNWRESGNRKFLVKLSKGLTGGGCHDVVEGLAATYARQISEWRMRMIQAQFPRLKDSITIADATERRIILRLVVHLYKFQSSIVRINEILNLFIENDGYYNYPNITEDANHLLAPL